MKKPKSKILEAIHESAADLFEAGVMERSTMQKFDLLCLKPIQLQATLLGETHAVGEDVPQAETV
jgi:DNA-binding transcriptional regulator YiaG